ncbi:MAG: hypothetical protein MUF25_20900, partial [Pirellulaceae bacterium]|nr:hypothetical protein [Pirellulaceae bacterium]
MKRQVSIPVWLTGLLLGAELAVCAAEVDALTGFQVKQGFRLELVAAEPLVLDPVAMSFDGDGRLFVAEHRNFPEADRGTAPLGRIRLLQDADGDGRFETSKDFADGLSAPSALICWDRGVIVAAGTEILHCQDADGDGRAEKRTVLLSAPTNTTGNTGAVMPIRSFVWGLDSRIHAAGGGLGVALPGIGVGLDAAWLPGQDFAFDPRAPAFEIESSFGSAGVSFDSRGRKFVCSETHPLRQVMWEARHVAGENRFALPTPLAEITGPLSATPLLALRAGSDGRPGIGSKNMRRVSEPFAGASSVLVYRGNSYPAAYSEDVFVADARAGVVHRFKLRTNAVELVAERAADDRGTEFLCSTNRWFRPVHLASGPDGALYVVDLHREFLDDTARLTESQSREAMSRRGNDRGRIYRIVPEKFTRPAAPQLENADTPGLLKQLTHLNGWHRDTAARLLHERSDVGAKLLSVNVAELAKSAYARLHALGVLDGQGLLQETNVTRRLRDPDERVRFRA